MTFAYYGEIYLAGLGFVDITDDIFGHTRQRVSIEHGQAGEDTTFRTSTCKLMLDCRAGKYSPVNPEGPYYGLLQLNTPFQFYKKQSTSSFTTSVASAWPTTDEGTAYTTLSVGGAINASDYNSTGGMGTHLVPAANASRTTYLADRLDKISDVLVDLKLDTTNITGAQVSWNVVFCGLSTAVYWRAEVAVQTDETIDLGLVAPDGTYAGFVQDIGITHVNTNTYRLRCQYEGWTVRMKLWLTSGVEPADWQAELHNKVATSPGWVGLQSRRDTGNSNGNLTFSYDNFVIRNPRHAGEISEFPVARDETGNDVYVSTVSSGIMRRVGVADAPLQSPPRAFIPGTFAEDHAATLVAYWALEDGQSALVGTSVVGAYDMVPVIGTEKPLSAHFGKGTLDAWLYPVWAQWGDGAFGSGGGGVHSYVSMPTFVAADGWRYDWVLRMSGSADCSVTANTGGTFWQFVFKPGTKFVDYTLPTGATASIDFTTSRLFDGSTHLFSLRTHQAGGNISWALDVDNVAVWTSSFTATLAAITGTGNGAPSTTPGTSAHAFGHHAIYDKDFVGSAGSEVADAVMGFPGERVATRMARLCTIASVPFFYDGRSGEGARLGVQSLSQLSSQLDDAVKADMGHLCDSRGTVGLKYRQLSDMYSRDRIVVLDYAAGELSPPLDPQFDDRFTANEVTATADGSTETVSLTTGPMSSASSAAGGIGLVRRGYPVNAATDQLRDIAGFRLGKGTVNGVRLPQVTVNLARPTLAAKVDALLQVEVGDRLDIDNLPRDIGGNTRQHVNGYSEEIDRFEHVIHFNTEPHAPYAVEILDSTVFDLASGDSFLNTTVDAVVTSWSVKSLDGTVWSTAAGDVPFNIIIGGEWCTVTAITGASSPQTFTVVRSVNGVVKGHTADDSELARVQVLEPARLALWEKGA